MNKQEQFNKLELKKFKIKDVSDNKYLVYKDQKEFTEVVASSAGEAIEKSQIAEPYMVMHYIGTDKPYYDMSQLEDMPIAEEKTEVKEETKKDEMTSDNKTTETSETKKEDKKEEQPKEETNPNEAVNQSPENQSPKT